MWAGIIWCTTQTSGSEHLGSLKDVKFLNCLFHNQQADIQSMVKVITYLAQERDRQRALVNAMVNLGVP